MILHSININKGFLAKILLIFMCYVLCSCVFSAQNNSFMLPDKSGYITWKCKNGSCMTFLERKNYNQELILKYSLPPSVELFR